jgi:putative transposase
MEKRYNPDIHHRRSVRLRGFDYSRPGAYFVTICVHDRKCLFGEVCNGKMNLNKAGRIVEDCLLDIPKHFPHARLDAFVIMPNHIHGIITIAVGAKNFSPLPNVIPPTRIQIRPLSKTIGSIVRGVKIGVTKWFRQNTTVFKVWQRNYFEHVIRDEADYNRIAEYIVTNPRRWVEDSLHPDYKIKNGEPSVVEKTGQAWDAECGNEQRLVEMPNVGAKNFSPLRVPQGCRNE